MVSSYEAFRQKSVIIKQTGLSEQRGVKVGSTDFVIFNAHFILYADDILLFKPIDTFDDANQI